MEFLPFVSLDTTGALEHWLDHVWQDSRCKEDDMAQHHILPPEKTASADQNDLANSQMVVDIIREVEFANRDCMCEPGLPPGHLYASLDDVLLHVADTEAGLIRHIDVKLSNWVAPESWSRLTEVPLGMSEGEVVSCQQRKTRRSECPLVREVEEHVARRPQTLELMRFAKRRIQASLRAAVFSPGARLIYISSDDKHGHSSRSEIESIKSYIPEGFLKYMRPIRFGRNFHASEGSGHAMRAQASRKSLKFGVCETRRNKAEPVTVNDNKSCRISTKLHEEEMPRITLEFPKHDEESQEENLLLSVLSTL